MMTFAVIIFTSFYLIVLSEERLPYDVTPNKDVLINSDDDDELNQALLLIDILKSDYLHLLRQNSENVTATVEQSTFAATTGLDNEASGSRSTRNESVGTLTTTVSASVSHDEFKPGLSTSAPWNSPMVHAAPLFPWRWSDLGTTRVYNYTLPFYHTRRPPQQRPQPRLGSWRRFFPDYYLYDIYPRRFYKHLGTYLPTSTRNKPLATLAPITTTTAVHTTATMEGPIRESTKNTKSTSLTASRKATSKSLRTAKRRPSTAAATQRTSRKHTFRKKASTLHTQDPVEAEVASELLKEFKLINVTPKTTRAKTPTVDSTSTE